MHVPELSVAPGAVHWNPLILSSTNCLVATPGAFTLGAVFNESTPSHMENQKSGFSRLFSRRRPGEFAAPDLNDLTNHLAIDPDAISSREGEPAFMAPPPGAKPYHGFLLLPEVGVGGFTLGTITDFLKDPDLETGDAFVEAPDGSRAGIEWHLTSEPYVLLMAPPSEERWGVWMVGFTEPMDSLDGARRNLAAIEPDLRNRWRSWSDERVDEGVDEET